MSWAYPMLHALKLNPDIQLLAILCMAYGAFNRVLWSWHAKSSPLPESCILDHSSKLYIKDPTPSFPPSCIQSRHDLDAYQIQKTDRSTFKSSPLSIIAFYRANPMFFCRNPAADCMSILMLKNDKNL